MQQGMVVDTAMGGMDMATIITTVTARATHMTMTMTMTIPTIMDIPTNTAMQLRPPQPRPVGAPCPSP